MISFGHILHAFKQFLATFILLQSPIALWSLHKELRQILVLGPVVEQNNEKNGTGLFVFGFMNVDPGLMFVDDLAKETIVGIIKMIMKTFILKDEIEVVLVSDLSFSFIPS